MTPALATRANAMDSGYGCPVELIVIWKRPDVVLQTEPTMIKDLEDGFSLGFALEEPLSKHSDCKQYEGFDYLRMNAVSTVLPALKSLQVGDSITGRLNYHAPSPFGKTLYAEYHHGLMVHTVKVAGDEKAKKLDPPLYYRHVGVFLRANDKASMDTVESDAESDVKAQ